MRLESKTFYCPLKDCTMLLNLIDDRWSTGCKGNRNALIVVRRRLFCSLCEVPWHVELNVGNFRGCIKMKERGRTISGVDPFDRTQGFFSFVLWLILIYFATSICNSLSSVFAATVGWIVCLLKDLIFLGKRRGSAILFSTEDSVPRVPLSNRYRFIDLYKRIKK